MRDGDTHHILVTHVWSDRNRGDAALTQVTIDALRRRFRRARITLMSEFGGEDVRVTEEMAVTRARYPDVALVGSLFPILPIARSARGGRLRAAADSLAAAARMLALPALAPLLRRPTIFGRIARSAARALLGGVNHGGFAAMLDADVVVCRGGGYLHGQPRLRSTLRLARVLFPLRLAQRLGIPVILAGHSIGPFATRAQRALARSAIGRASWIGVREAHSHAEVRALTDGAAPVVVAPDLAWHIRPAVGSRVDAVRDEMRRHARPWVGLVVRHWPGLAGEGVVAAVRAICRHVREELGGTVFAWAQSTGPGPLEDDRPLLRMLSDHDGAAFLADDLDAEQLVAVYADHDAFVSARFHGAVLAMRAGVPTLVIDTWGPKLGGLMEALGVSAWRLDGASVDGDSAVAALSALIAASDDLRRHLAERTATYREEIDAALDEGFDTALAARAASGGGDG